jgi:Domain of unknown function (DUF4142)
MRAGFLFCALLSACANDVRAGSGYHAYSDPEALHYLETLCFADIMVGGTAQTQAYRTSVQFLGNTLVDDDTAMLKQLQMFDTQYIPLRTPGADSIAAEAKEMYDIFMNVSGAAYDQEFINYQIAKYAAWMNTLQYDIIPYAGNAIHGESEDMLIQVNGHWEQANKLFLTVEQ